MITHTVHCLKFGEYISIVFEHFVVRYLDYRMSNSFVKEKMSRHKPCCPASLIYMVGVIGYRIHDLMMYCSKGCLQNGKLLDTFMISSQKMKTVAADR